VKLQSQKLQIESSCLQNFRDKQSDEFAQRLKNKVQKETQREIETGIRDKVFHDIIENGEIEAKITQKVQQVYEKKLAQEKRKMKLEMEAKEKENQEAIMKEFDKEVKSKSQALTQKREIDINRKFRI